MLPLVTFSSEELHSQRPDQVLPSSYWSQVWAYWIELVVRTKQCSSAIGSSATREHRQSKSNITKSSTRKENSVNRAIDNNDECLTSYFALVDLCLLYYSTYRHGNEIKNACSNHTIKREKKYKEYNVCSFLAFVKYLPRNQFCHWCFFWLVSLSLSLSADLLIEFQKMEW